MVLPPMEVRSVDRTVVERTTHVDRWLALMNQAIDASTWCRRHEALATYMGVDKAYLSRLRSGEKPWRVEHITALPVEIEKLFETRRAESFGLIVVEPVTGEQAVRNLVSGLCGLLCDRDRKAS